MNVNTYVFQERARPLYSRETGNGVRSFAAIFWSHVFLITRRLECRTAALVIPAKVPPLPWHPTQRLFFCARPSLGYPSLPHEMPANHRGLVVSHFPDRLCTR